MNTINELVDKPVAELQPSDIKEIIAFQRKARANFEAGIKPSKAKSESSKASVSKLIESLDLKPKSNVIINRRF